MASSQEAILFLGSCGAGKSSIIGAATGANVHIGHGSLSCTKSSTGWNFTSKNDRSVTLIDSPGFGQLGMSDSNVLHSMTQYLEAHPNLRVIAMARWVIPQNLSHLCGEHYYKNVVVVNTMWNSARKLALPAWEARESNFCETKHGWGDTITKGASYLRYNGTGESSKNIVEACLCKIDPTPPHFVSELQKGVVSDQITLSLQMKAAGYGRPLDAKGRACVKKMLHESRQEDDYYLEGKGAFRTDNGSLEHEPSGS